MLAVLVVASTSARRMFKSDELALLQSLGNEAALALDRLRSAAALADALERERVIAGSPPSSGLSSTSSPCCVLRSRRPRALGAQRAFIRLGDATEQPPVAVEWHSPEVEPVAANAQRLPVSNLALRERRTVAVEDIDLDIEIRDPALGSVEALREVGSRAALATPIGMFDETVGVFALHRSRPGQWTRPDVAIAEAVARETGIALHIARLLARERGAAALQRSLFGAAQHVTAELDLDTVLQRLVDELAALLGVGAADIYLHDVRRGVLRCAAVHGLPPDLVGLEFADDLGLSAEAVRLGTPVIAADYERVSRAASHPAYDELAGAIVVPIGSSERPPGRRGGGCPPRACPGFPPGPADRHTDRARQLPYAGCGSGAENSL